MKTDDIWGGHSLTGSNGELKCGIELSNQLNKGWTVNNMRIGTPPNGSDQTVKGHPDIQKAHSGGVQISAGSNPPLATNSISLLVGGPGEV